MQGFFWTYSTKSKFPYRIIIWSLSVIPYIFPKSHRSLRDLLRDFDDKYTLIIYAFTLISPKPLSKNPVSECILSCQALDTKSVKQQKNVYGSMQDFFDY